MKNVKKTISLWQEQSLNFASWQNLKCRLRQSLKYLLSSPPQKKFADPSSDTQRGGALFAWVLGAFETAPFWGAVLRMLPPADTAKPAAPKVGCGVPTHPVCPPAV